MNQYDIEAFSCDTMDLDKALFEDLWVHYVVNRDQKVRRVVLERRIKNKMIKLYGEIRKLEKKKIRNWKSA